jgi:hypothetical protein
MAVAVAVAVVAWPVRSLAPGVGGDFGWVSALSTAAEQGLRFGDRIAWSYGPLGFLDTSYGPVLYYADVLVATWLFTALIQLLLAGTLLAALRRALPLPLAAVAAAVVVALAPERMLALGFAWCALALLRDERAPPGRAARAFPLALGVLTAIALLGKLNEGIELLLLAAIALAATARRRDVAGFGVALLATALAGWLATGQTVADAWPYVRNSIQVLAGYPAAMGASDPAHRWALPAALALAALALAVAWDAGRGRRPAVRWGLLAACALYALLDLKAGFVREDPGHAAEYFGDVLVLFAVLLARPRRRPLLLGSVAAVVVAVGAVLGTQEAVRMLNPVENVRAAADQVGTLASPARQDAILAGLRQGIAAEYRLAPELIAAVGRRTVMLWPNLYAEIAFADRLNLRPLPTLEPYTAYTPALDRLGARMLASRRAPQRILRALSEGIDGRIASFEAPLATLAILCRYHHVAAQPPWQLLAHGTDRCGSTRQLATASAPWGAAVRVPRARRREALVLVRIADIAPRGLERLRALLLRPARRLISLDGAQPRPFVVATAADGLLLRAPDGADYPRPFALAPDPSRIAVTREGGQPGGRVRFTFVEVALRGSARAG